MVDDRQVHKKRDALIRSGFCDVGVGIGVDIVSVAVVDFVVVKLVPVGVCRLVGVEVVKIVKILKSKQVKYLFCFLVDDTTLN